MDEEKKEELLIRIDERVGHLVYKVDNLISKQPKQDEKISTNTTDIAVNKTKIMNSRIIFSIVVSIIAIGAIIAKAMGD